MSLFTNISAGDVRPMPEANILGAASLSRARLAAMFRRNGLFGPDSALSPDEQEVALACLRIPGVASSSVIPDTTTGLEVLR